MKADSRLIHVTIFRNKSAQTLETRDMPLADLRDLILRTTAKDKGELPLLKLQTFGGKRTDKNCLRTNANVITINGIEIEHDRKVVTFEAAVATLKDARLHSLIYTSPSYREGAPKWRALLPTSRDLPPAERVKLVAWVNGLFGGEIAPESFTLSQAFYYGSVDSNPAHRVEIIDGDFIDLRTDLDAGAIYKRGAPRASGAGRRSASPRAGGSRGAPPVVTGDARLDAMIEDIRTGENYHESLRDLAFWLVMSDMSEQRAVKLLEDHMDGSEGEHDERWQARYDSIPGLVRSAMDIKLIQESSSAEQQKTKTEEPKADTSAPEPDEPKAHKHQTTDDDHLIQSSGEFATNFVPPDYLIDGLLQKRFIYSMTGPTGSGKTSIALLIAFYVARGLPIDGREVLKSPVLFFAGENPDDIRMRWIKLCEEMNVDVSDVEVFFIPGQRDLAPDGIRKRIKDEATARRGLAFGLAFIDTSAAFYTGNDENDNVQLGRHARMMRSLIDDLPGGPTIIPTCHPTKTPNMENLLPRGGGSFIAEMDGNLVCMKNDLVVDLHWHGKFRGPDFAPIPFKLQPGTTEKLQDRKGRAIWTVTAAPITEAERSGIDDAGHKRQKDLLALMKAEPDLSLAAMAEKLKLRARDGSPYKMLVQRTLKELERQKFVESKMGKWVLTKKGKDAAPEWREPTQADLDLADRTL